MHVLWPNFKREIDGIKGLAIVVVQDHKTSEVLMVAFTDEAGWKQTLESGKVSLFSTSRKESWIKGKGSGNFMKIKDIRLDCDGDAIVCLVEPQGKGLACHTEARTCFYRSATFPSVIAIAPKAGPDEDLQTHEFDPHADLQP
jgi:phosphoribosyl-AMP cyclohydrolase